MHIGNFLLMLSPTLDLSRLRIFLLDLLLRRSVRGCRSIWTALWRFLRKFLAVHPPRLQHSLASLPSSLRWKITGCNYHGQSYAAVDARSQCYGLIDPTEGVSVQGKEVATGAALPYIISEGSHPAELTQSTNPQIPSTASTQTDGPALVTLSVEHSSIPERSDSLSCQSPDNDGYTQDEENNILVLSPSRSSRASASSKTLNNIPMHVLPVDAWSRNGSSHSVVAPAGPTIPSNPLYRVRSVESSASSWEISSFVWPMIPTQVPRYENNRIVNPVDPEFTLRPAQKNFERDDIPSGWTQYTHPEGQPYFYNTQSEMAIITETWIGDPELWEPLRNFIDEIADFIRSKNLCFHETDLVLYCSLDNKNQPWCGYYFVSHSTRSLFWLEKFEIDQHLDELRGELHPNHIKLFLESQYWYHWNLYPDVNKATDEILDMLSNTILDAQTDILTGNASTVNYTENSLSAMSGVVETARRHVAAGHQTTTWYIGRFMMALWRDRFLNFHGQYGARLSRKQSIHVRDQKVPRSYLFKTLSPMLFSAPNVHLKTMTGIWVDRLTLKAPWAEFFTGLGEEWEGQTVFASILLTANVAFLAIPMNDSGDSYIRSATQVASYISVVTSFASMMLALLLRRQHRPRERGTAKEVHEFLEKRDDSRHGLEILAIVYSLPYAILMWGMVTFFLAFFTMCFAKSTTATRCVVGLVSVFCAVLVAWCIWMSWESSESLEWWKAQLRWQTSVDDVETTAIWQRIRIWRRRNPPPSVTGDA